MVRLAVLGMNALPASADQSGAPTDDALLSVRELHVQFRTEQGTVNAVNGVSFDLHRNEVLCIVGESGSGKSATALAILGLLPRNADVSGEVIYQNRTMRDLSPNELRMVRGRRIAMVFQDSLAAMHPLQTVGSQVAEAIRVHHRDVRARAARARAVELLGIVGINEPRIRAKQYPWELSGGMRQRAMIAMAIANDADVLVADEPTTSLDVTTQAQVLELLETVRERLGSAMVLITHDLGVVASVADRVLVMYAGRVVETGGVREIFREPNHPYTQGLLASLPSLGRRRTRLERIAGQPPSPINVPSGCPFHPRCPIAQLEDPCATARPVLETSTSVDHLAACHFAKTDPRTSTSHHVSRE